MWQQLVLRLRLRLQLRLQLHRCKMQGRCDRMWGAAQAAVQCPGC